MEIIHNECLSHVEGTQQPISEKWNYLSVEALGRVCSRDLKVHLVSTNMMDTSVGHKNVHD